jgi:hypothetical protein
MAYPRRGPHGGEYHSSQGTPHRERTQMGDALEDDTRDWGVRPSGKGQEVRLPMLDVGPHPWGACAYLGELCAFHQPEPCPDKACSATDAEGCRYPGWRMCLHRPGQNWST